MDRSTLMGKGTGELAAQCRDVGVPCIALGGDVADRDKLAKKFTLVGALTDLTSPKRARAGAKLWLEKLASRTARNFTMQAAD
jgi:hypothetical protein